MILLPSSASRLFVCWWRRVDEIFGFDDTEILQFQGNLAFLLTCPAFFNAYLIVRYIHILIRIFRELH